jgi:hypothetical protein
MTFASSDAPASFVSARGFTSSLAGESRLFSQKFSSGRPRAGSTKRCPSRPRQLVGEKSLVARQSEANAVRLVGSVARDAETQDQARLGEWSVADCEAEWVLGACPDNRGSNV